MNPKISPFLVLDVLSPLQCESILKEHRIQIPSISENGQPLKYTTYLLPHAKFSLNNRIKEYAEEINNHYQCEADINFIPVFEQYFENLKTPAAYGECEAYKFWRKKWTKVKEVQLTGIIWLKDYQDTIPFDLRSEVYGGKLEFPNFNFSFMPSRGTMVLFPAIPNFTFAMSHVMAGDLEQIKFNLKVNEDWSYNENLYSNNYKDWM